MSHYHSFLIIMLNLMLTAKGPCKELYNKSLTEEEKNEKVSHLSEAVRKIIEHYKQVDPVGIPGVTFEDPMPIPEFKHSNNLVFKNASIYGLSKFKVDYLSTDLANMQAEAILGYSKLEVLGNYTISHFFTRSSSGNFNVTLVGVQCEGVGLLSVTRLGNLEATDIRMDIFVNDIQIDFKNIGLIGSLLQSMINTIGPWFFDRIKPYMLRQLNTDVHTEVNKNLQTVKKTFPNSIPPLDLAIAELRKFVREKYGDPYKFEDYKQSYVFLNLDVTEIWITGIASFYRIGNITVTMENNMVSIICHVGTKRLKGSCKWEVSTGILAKDGYTSFTIEYIQIELKINQSLNVRNTPQLDDFQMKLGNIQLRMDGLGTLDYIFEFMTNILPNIIRSQIVDFGEIILRQRIQDLLDTIDVEKEIESQLLKIDDVIGPNNVTTYLDPPEDDLFTENLMDDID